MCLHCTSVCSCHTKGIRKRASFYVASAPRLPLPPPYTTCVHVVHVMHAMISDGDGIRSLPCNTRCQPTLLFRLSINYVTSLLISYHQLTFPDDGDPGLDFKMLLMTRGRTQRGHPGRSYQQLSSILNIYVLYIKSSSARLASCRIER